MPRSKLLSKSLKERKVCVQALKTVHCFAPCAVASSLFACLLLQLPRQP